MKRYFSPRVLLVIILLAGFIARFYGFNNPIADWHSWRQSETAAVSRIYAENGFDLLHPKMYNISNVQSGLDNPHGYFFVEFPIYNALQAGLFKVFGVFTIEQWGRLLSMSASVAAGLFLYLIVKRRSNETIGLFAAFFYMLLPYDIYYGRTILPDTSMTMAFLGSIYFFDKWLYLPEKKKEKKVILNYSFYLSLLFTILALLLKPHSVFFLLPTLLYIIFQRFGWHAFKQWRLYIFAVVSVLPLLAWRLWISQFPEGIPSSAWLFNSNGIRFRPAFFRWLFYERLTKLISGYGALVPLVVGVVALRKTKEWMFFGTFLLSTVLYICIIATGNVQHDYYQIPTIPSLAIFLALGSYVLWNWNSNKIALGKIILVISVLVSFYFSWNIVKEYFNINNPSLQAAGEAVQRLTPKDALVVANYNGDSSVLYAMQRKGWASFEHSVPVLAKMGADYLVLINPSETDRMQWENSYKLVLATGQFAIFDLHHK